MIFLLLVAIIAHGNLYLQYPSHTCRLIFSLIQFSLLCFWVHNTPASAVTSCFWGLVPNFGEWGCLTGACGTEAGYWQIPTWILKCTILCKALTPYFLHAALSSLLHLHYNFHLFCFWSLASGKKPTIIDHLLIPVGPQTSDPIYSHLSDAQVPFESFYFVAFLVRIHSHKH